MPTDRSKEPQAAEHTQGGRFLNLVARFGFGAAVAAWIGLPTAS